MTIVDWARTTGYNSIPLDMPLSTGIQYESRVTFQWLDENLYLWYAVYPYKYFNMLGLPPALAAIILPKFRENL